MEGLVPVREVGALPLTETGSRISPASPSGVILNTEKQHYSWAFSTRKILESLPAGEIGYAKAVHYLVNEKNSPLASPLILMKSCLLSPYSLSKSNYILKKEVVGKRSMHHAIRLSDSPFPAVQHTEETCLSPNTQESRVQGSLHLSLAGHWRLYFTKSCCLSIRISSQLPYSPGL